MFCPHVDSMWLRPALDPRGLRTAARQRCRSPCQEGAPHTRPGCVKQASRAHRGPARGRKGICVCVQATCWREQRPG